MRHCLRQDKNILLETIDKLTQKSKGILAADESTNTIGKRLKVINLENNHENRKNYRKMLFSTKNLEKYISGIILYEETFYDEYVKGTTFSEYLKQKNIVPGIKVDQGLVSINTDDEKMTDLNLRHLGIDSTTDVLSFSNTNSLKKNKNFVSSEESGIMPEFIGEVVISSPQAEQQATEKGISFMEEVAFLLAHGILHLLGRDHETEDERIEMESLHRQTLFAMLGKSSIPIEVNYLA